jgi:predicted pore-forming effector associated with SMODS systems
MHPYTSDSIDNRPNIQLYLFILSILFAWGLGWAQQKAHFSIPWWLDAPAVLGFYGILFKAFDDHLWRFKGVRILCGVKTPNLNGQWQGYVSSSFDSHGQKYDASLDIRQTWTRIKITLKTANSSSQSQTAMMNLNDPSEMHLSYEFLNEPKVGAAPTLHTHRGTAHLTVKTINSKTVLEGDYYTGRGRGNQGTLFFEKAA